MWNTVNMEIERFASKNRNQFSRGRWMREENFAKLVLLLRFFLFLFFLFILRLRDSTLDRNEIPRICESL